MLQLWRVQQLVVFLQYVAAPDIINRFPIVECLSFMPPAQSASENPTGSYQLISHT